MAKEYALMCPTCKAIVGVGTEDDPGTPEFLSIARRAGLMVLEMWCDTRISESCSCPKPNPSSKMATMMALSGSWKMETHDGKPFNVNEALGLPDLKGLKPDQIDAATAQIRELLGEDVRQVEIREEFAPRLPWMTQRNTEPIYAFRLGGFLGLFIVVGLQDRDGYHLAIFTEHGFQVWPKKVGHTLTMKRKNDAKKHVMRGIVEPFVTTMMSRTTPAKFNAWVQGNIDLMKDAEAKPS